MKLVISLAALTLQLCTPVYADELDIKLIGGTVTTSREIVNLNGGMCTGSVVGARTVLTAGHCFSTGSKISFNIDGKKVTGTCLRNPDYKSWFGIKNDHTLCYLDSKVKPPYAYIDSREVQRSELVQLAGYGCFNTKKQNDGKLRAGVIQISGTNTTEFTTSGKVALCFGDSGGSVFRYGEGYQDIARYSEASLWENGGAYQRKGYLAVIGINSRGNISTYSILDKVSTPSFQKFAANYISRYSTPICGLKKCE